MNWKLCSFVNSQLKDKIWNVKYLPFTKKAHTAKQIGCVKHFYVNKSITFSSCRKSIIDSFFFPSLFVYFVTTNRTYNNQLRNTSPRNVMLRYELQYSICRKQLVPTNMVVSNYHVSWKWRRVIYSIWLSGIRMRCCVYNMLSYHSALCSYDWC